MSFHNNKVSAGVHVKASGFEHANECSALQRDIEHQSLLLLGGWAAGSSESCRSYVEITKWLILEYGLKIIAIDSDNAPAQRVNQFILGENECASAGEALAGFCSFPRWRWRNTVISDFVSWLRRHNEDLPAGQRVHFCGLNAQNTFAIIERTLGELAHETSEITDVQRFYQALDPLAASWERQQLTAQERLQVASALSQIDLQAEHLEAGETSYLQRWLLNPTEHIHSLHVRHMVEQIRDVKQQYERQFNCEGKMVVWTQNSSISGARHTNRPGLAQLLREHYGARCMAIGQTCYGGSITAADSWSAPAQRVRLPAAEAESVEALFHRLGKARFYLPIDKAVAEHLAAGYWHREIAGIYRTQQPRSREYLPWCESNGFDAIIHTEESGALEPLDPTVQWIIGNNEGGAGPPH